MLYIVYVVVVSQLLN